MKHDSVVHDKAYNVPVQPDAFIEKTGRFSARKIPGRTSGLFRESGRHFRFIVFSFIFSVLLP